MNENLKNKFDVEDFSIKHEPQKYFSASLHFGGKEHANHYLVRLISWWQQILFGYGTVLILEELSIPTFTKSKVALVELI